MPVLDNWHGTRYRVKLGRAGYAEHSPASLRRFHSHQERLTDQLQRTALAIKKRNIYLYPVDTRARLGILTALQDASDLPARFNALAEAWKDATRFSSSPEEIAMHPSYQQIIGMGPDALPLILTELERQPDHWFWALNAIVGDDIARDTETVEGAAQAWISWGAEHGIITRS